MKPTSGLVGRLGLPGILVAFVALALAMSATIPLGEAPDEVSHYSYVAAIRLDGRLPEPAGAAVGEAHQPPLYYLLLAVLTSWMPDAIRPVQANPEFSLSDQSAPNLLLHPGAEDFPYEDGALLWHLMRAVSVCLGAVTVWGTYRLAERLFPGHVPVALGSAALLAFLPSFLLISSVVNNDNLLVALSTLTLVQWSYMAGTTPRMRDGVLLGALFGLASLTKMTGFILWGTAGLGFLVMARPAATRRAWLVAGGAALGAAGLVAFPWFAYTALVYGDPLAWSRFLRVTPRTEPFMLADWGGYVQSMLTSLVGRYGGASHLRLPDALYLVVGGLAAAAMVGLPRVLQDYRAGRLTRPASVSLALMVGFVVVLVAAHVRLMTFILGMDQARHVFAGLPVLVLLLTYSLWRLAGRRSGVLVLAGGTMVAVALVTLVMVTVTYGRLASPVVAVAPDRKRADPADFGSEIRLTRAWLAEDRVVRGDSLVLFADWQALQQPQREYWLQLQLVGPGDRDTIAVVSDGVPAEGRVTTDRWRMGETYQSRHSMAIPADLAPGTYALELGLRPFQDWDWLPVGNGIAASVGVVQIVAGP